jgi:hypothetical protein
MQKMLERLDQKIGQYENHIVPAEKKLQRKGHIARSESLVEDV